MIDEKIRKDVVDEFSRVREAVERQLKPNCDLSQERRFLKTHIPKEVLHKSEILLDTLINYLMENARDKIKNLDPKLQNSFYDADFRNRIYKWTTQLENQLLLKPDFVMYTPDPRLKQGLRAFSVTFVAGTCIAVAFVPNVLGVIVSGIVTLLSSAYAFRFSYCKATPKAFEVARMDIERYLQALQGEVLEWLKKIQVAFDEDLRLFFANNGFALEENKNG